MPSFLQGGCNEVIGKRVDDIVRVYQQSGNALAVCTAIKACRAPDARRFIADLDDEDDEEEEEDGAIFGDYDKDEDEDEQSLEELEEDDESAEELEEDESGHLAEQLEEDDVTTDESDGQKRHLQAQQQAARGVPRIDARVIYKGIDRTLRLQPNAVSTIDEAPGPQCQVCQWAVSAIEAYISQPQTEEELSRVIQELCTLLPPQYATVCQNFVSVYMEEAVDYLINNLTPPVICERIQVCPTPNAPPTPSKAA